MTGTGFKIGSILGFEVRLDASWFILFFLLLWTLGMGVFPASAPEQSPAVHALMGLVATILFFASLLAHELSHSVVARSKGLPVGGITLFVFGGVAHTSAEPESPRDELLIAGIGPLVSLLLGLAFLGAAATMRVWGWSPAAHEVSRYLGFINVALAIFNLLPGYPLDGGRVFRALAWRWTGSRARATRWATAGGRWLGLALVALGVLQALAGALIGGAWLVFIGLFLRGAAGQALEQHELERHLSGTTARDLMARHPEVVSAHTPLGSWVEGALMRTSRTAFPVVDDGRVVGAITLEQVEATPRERWDSMTVGEAMTGIDRSMIVAPETDAKEVLRRVRGRDGRLVLVIDSGELVGLVSSSELAAMARRSRLVSRR